MCLTSNSAVSIATAGSGQPGERRITVSQYGEGKAGAKLRGIRISPKKLNHFAKVIRRMHVEDALAQCQVSVKKAARFCAKVADLPIRFVLHDQYCAVWLLPDVSSNILLNVCEHNLPMARNKQITCPWRKETG